MLQVGMGCGAAGSGTDTTLFTKKFFVDLFIKILHT